jgi:tetratricopeptide (TPR) repeat protein
MWLVGEGDLLLVATNDSPGPVLDNIASGWRREGVADDLAKASVFDPFSLLTLYVGGPGELARYASGAALETDDRPALEFSAPIGLYGRPLNENRRRLQALLEPAAVPAALSAAVAGAGAGEWRHRAQMSVGVRDYSAAYDDFARSLQLDPEDEQALTGLIDAAGAAQRGDEARILLESLARARPSSATIGVARARLLAALDAPAEAIIQAQAVINRAPADPRGSEALASILADAGDLDRLVPLVEQMRRTRPDRDETWYYAAMASFLAGDLVTTVSHAEAALRINARHAPALNLIGSASAALGRHDRARQAFQASLAVNPRESTTYANLGLLEMAAGNRDRARAYFVEALSVDPTETAAREGLTTLRAASPAGGW